MANLIVTLAVPRQSGAPGGQAPVAEGASARTEQIAIPAASDGSSAASNTARDNERVVSLTALAACWIAVGSAPVAAVGSGWYMAAGDRLDLGIKAGETVAVIGA